MKKILKYGTFLAIGLFLGWLFFSGNAGHKDGTAQDEDTVWICSMHPQIRQDSF